MNQSRSKASAAIEARESPNLCRHIRNMSPNRDINFNKRHSRSLLVNSHLRLDEKEDMKKFVD